MSKFALICIFVKMATVLYSRPALEWSMGNEKVLDLRNLQLNILLVEDSKADAHDVRRVLDRYMTHPCNVRHVECMADAEAVLREAEIIDVILLDLDLPDTVNPKETFKKIGLIRNGIPIIVLTSIEDSDLAMLIVDGGAEDYLRKSLISDKPELLCDAIDFAVCRRRKLASSSPPPQDEDNKIVHWISGTFSD